MTHEAINRIIGGLRDALEEPLRRYAQQEAIEQIHYHMNHKLKDEVNAAIRQAVKDAIRQHVTIEVHVKEAA